MPATKGGSAASEPEDTTASGQPTGELSAEEKKARGIETRAKAAEKEKAREQRLADAEQRRATERVAEREESTRNLTRPALLSEKEQAAEEQRVRKELGFTEPSPRWWAPLMVTLMVLGLLWVVVFYISQAELPIKSIGNWNILVGFALMLVGFAMTTRWR